MCHCIIRQQKLHFNQAEREKEKLISLYLNEIRDIFFYQSEDNKGEIGNIFFLSI